MLSSHSRAAFIGDCLRRSVPSSSSIDNQNFYREGPVPRSEGGYLVSIGEISSKAEGCRTVMDCVGSKETADIDYAASPIVSAEEED